MNCLITAGPTYEPLDRVRRLTNFSTGSLGSRLAGHLAQAGHDVTLLLGEQATYPGPFSEHTIQRFSTTADLMDRFRAHSQKSMGAIFHAAAVSDFTFGKVLAQDEGGEWVEARSGKLSTRGGVLRAELVPTPKLLPQLRGLFPNALIVGWKFEVDGDRAQVIERGRQQIQDSQSDLCVVNGAAYGDGFGLLSARTSELKHISDALTLFVALAELLRAAPSSGSR